MRRRLAVFGLLVLLVALSGCSSILGPGEPDQARLNENASYDWETDVNVSLTINKSSYKGVYDVTNRSTLELYNRDELGTEHNIDISGLRYQYPNGTVVTADHPALSVEKTRERTILNLPNESAGHVAFTAQRHGKQFTTPVFVEGSHAVELPQNARVGIPLLSQVSPGDYRTTVSEGRMTILWDDVTSRTLRVRWYLQRDLLLFSGIVAAAVVIGSGGALYYYRQILQLKRRREETAIDIDEDDDPRDRGPPPGMR